jgi:formyltetrahydrofolate-dependent phosphoribosylglycinamide formyltransferase
MDRARVAVLLSGTGSNMAAIVYAAKAPDCPYEVVLVASNNPASPGLELAAGEGIATFVQSHAGMTREAHDAAMQAALIEARADYVALAGYMRILTPEFVSKWEGRMVNIHPSLLPKYKGLRTHQQALDAGDRMAGCSVHLVTAALDDGPVLGQTEVAILPGDNAETLAARVLIAEHQLYPRMLIKLITRERDPQWLLERVRQQAMALPEADEVLSHGMPCFGIAKGKKFGYFSSDHHGDGRIALIVKISGVDEQQMLISQDEQRYYRPAYFGDGWIGIRLDLGDVDWDGIGDWLARSWRAVAPKTLTKLMDLADEF